jgi:hypothetical protein
LGLVGKYTGTAGEYERFRDGPVETVRLLLDLLIRLLREYERFRDGPVETVRLLLDLLIRLLRERERPRTGLELRVGDLCVSMGRKVRRLDDTALLLEPLLTI